LKVSGFTFARNAVRLRYPLAESIRSVLPLVDEMIVNVGRSDDGTLELVRGIGDPRIVVVESVWDETYLARGRILAEQTDIALDRCTGDVCLYAQADEVLHEDDHPRIREALAGLHRDPEVEGLLFDWIHFYGSFHTVGISRRWYRQEIRAFKSGLGVRSWKDAQGFRIWAPPPGWKGERPRSLKTGDPARKLRVAHSGARVFHYGWVRPPDAQTEKLAEFERLYEGDEARRRRLASGFSYDVGEKVRRFEGTHPAPMAARVAAEDWVFEPRTRVLRPGHLREDLLDLFEAGTGIRIGEYRNFERIR
jgi:hypothetical protein